MADTPNTNRPAGSGAPSGPGGRPRGAGFSGGPRGGGRRPGGPGGFRRRVCRVCQERQGFVDWKAVNFLRTFVTDRGKIIGARSRGTCSKCQRQLTRAIKRARVVALVPFSAV